VAPTKPLVAQQIEACYRFMGLTRAAMVEMTGATTKADTRKATWAAPNLRIVFCTPQTLWNDVRKGVCPYDAITCIVADECHRATGEADLVKTLKFLRAKKLKFRVLGLSATPGSTPQQVQEVLTNIGASVVEFRSEGDPDVAPYVHGKRVSVHVVAPGREAAALRSGLLSVLREVLARLSETRVGVEL
jgi:ERCC4-related helicase